MAARDRCIGGRGGFIDNVSLSSFKSRFVRRKRIQLLGCECRAVPFSFFRDRHLKLRERRGVSREDISHGKRSSEERNQLISVL